MQHPNKPYLEFKDKDAPLCLEAVNLSYPKTISDWDRNWIGTNVLIKAGIFSGEFVAIFMTVETKFRIEKGDKVIILQEGNNYMRDY